MPQHRNSLEAPAERRFGFMVPAHAPEPARAFSALSVACPSCAAEIGQSCKGDRFCRERVDAAVGHIRAGELAEVEAVEVAETADVSRCRDCAKEKTQRGHAVACDRSSHRCQRLLTNGTPCRRAVEPGSRWCPSHRQRWC